MSSRVTPSPRSHPRRAQGSPPPEPPPVQDSLGGPPPPLPAHSGSLPSLATHFIATFRSLDYFTLYEGPRSAARHSSSPSGHPVVQIPPIITSRSIHDRNGKPESPVKIVRRLR